MAPGKIPKRPRPTGRQNSPKRLDGPDASTPRSGPFCSPLDRQMSPIGRTLICMLLMLVLGIFSNFASVPYQPS